MKDQEEQPSDFFSKLKSYLPGLPGAGGNWRVSAIVGVIAGVLISGPVGIGVAAGMYFASRTKEGGMVAKGKNAVLMGTGAGITAVSTATGAAIGSAIFPVVGTFIGAIAGLVGGLIASKIATEVIKRKYMSSQAPGTPSEAHTNKPSTKAHGHGHGQEYNNVSPSQTPSSEKKDTGMRK